MGEQVVIPLPTLTVTPSPNLYVEEIKVLRNPTAEEKNGLTWIVDEPPATPINAGKYIRLKTGEQLSGIGRVGHVTVMRKHWITFAISHTKQACTIRAPTAWVSLSELERHTHTTRYNHLPDAPRPHPSLRNVPNLVCLTVSPYRPRAQVDEQSMERRLYKIANAGPLALHTSQTAQCGLSGEERREMSRDGKNGEDRPEML